MPHLSIGNAGKSWANIADEDAPLRHSSKKGEPVPEEGDTKGEGHTMMIYTRRPTTLSSGESVRGHWTRAHDPEGDYGGPYADYCDMLADSRYRSDMKDIYGIEVKPCTRSRSRNHKHSRNSRRSHSRRSHSHSRRSHSRYSRR